MNGWEPCPKKCYLQSFRAFASRLFIKGKTVIYTDTIENSCARFRIDLDASVDQSDFLSITRKVVHSICYIMPLGNSILVTIDLYPKCNAAIWAWLSLPQKGVRVCSKDMRQLIAKYIWKTRKQWQE